MGEAKIVGKIQVGVLSFEPNENPNGNYFVVTQAYVLYYNYLQAENAEQSLTIESLREQLKKK